MHIATFNQNVLPALCEMVKQVPDQTDFLKQASGIKILAKSLWSEWLWVGPIRIGECSLERFRWYYVTGETMLRCHAHCFVSTHHAPDGEDVVGKAMITRSQCSFLSTAVTSWMPKTKRECIPRAKETSDLVEDEKIRSKAVVYIAHSPAQPLYHFSINRWPQSKDQHEN